MGLAAVVAVHELAELVVIANGVRAARRKDFQHRDPQTPTPARVDVDQPRTAVPA